MMLDKIESLRIESLVRELEKSSVPMWLQQNILDYTARHILPDQQFFLGMIQNNFWVTLKYSADLSLSIIKDSIAILANPKFVPQECWGSREAVEKWTDIPDEGDIQG